MSSAIPDVIGRSDLKMFHVRNGAFPATKSTAIVSPTARPMPRIPAPMMPDDDDGTIVRQIVCHFVAPRASDASR